MTQIKRMSPPTWDDHRTQQTRERHPGSRKHLHEFRGEGWACGTSGHLAHDLMAGDEPWLTLCKFPFNDAEVSSADAAGANP
jgi:hypothetical protein